MNEILPIIAEALNSFPDAWFTDLDAQLKGTAPLKAPSLIVAPLYALLEKNRKPAAEAIDFLLTIERTVQALEKFVPQA